MRSVFTALALMLLANLPASAQTKLKIMVGGIDKQIYLPAKLAEQLGFFKEEGLDVELFNSNSGSQAATESSLPFYCPSFACHQLIVPFCNGSITVAEPDAISTTDGVG